MKLAVSMWSYHRDAFAGRLTIPDFIREVKRIGADGVELLDAFYKDPATERETAKAALEETGLPCPIFSVGNNFAKETPEERAAEVAKIRFGIGEAKFCSAKVVRVFAGDVREGLDFETTRGWIVEGLAEASRIADGEGVRLALENHGRLAGLSDQVRGIIHDVRARAGNDALGANPDTGNFLLVDEASHDAVEDLASYAYMVHFKDFAEAITPDAKARAMKSNDGHPYIGAAIGEGVVDLRRCIEHLQNAGYRGWLSIEYEGEEPSETAVKRSVINAQRYL